MRTLGWLLLQLWRWVEPAERLDWILETLGLRARIHQIIAASLGGIAMFIFQRLRDAPIDWIIIMVLGSCGLIFYLLNQLTHWADIRSAHNTLRALNPNAQPTVKFFTWRRVSTYIVTAFLALFTLSLHRGPSGIEWPWFAASRHRDENITLRYLYDHDYGNYLTQGKDYTMGLVEIPAARITISVKMILDFEHRAKWLYAYLPLNNGTYRASLWLAQNTDTIIDELEREVPITNDNMLGTGAMSGKDLIFSRRIYIYHDMTLTDKERTMIQSEALKSNLDIVFRGLRYLQDHKK